MKKIYFVMFLSMLVLLSCAPKEKTEKVEIKVPNLSIYEHQQTKDIVQLVYDAVNEIELRSVDAFAQFRVEGSKWYNGDTYVFVWGMDGMRYVYPRDPSGEGKNMLDLKDENGKPIGQEFVDAANQDEGWVFYMWSKPGADVQSQKTTFIKKAIDHTGNEYLVGCGLYDMPTEKVLEVKAE